MTTPALLQLQDLVTDSEAGADLIVYFRDDAVTLGMQRVLHFHCFDHGQLLAGAHFVACIDGPYVGHLAVIDLTTSPMRLLSYVPIAFVPEGMEFLPDGTMLFVQATVAHHIAVYSVEVMRLVPSPFVLHTGEGPASMALAPR